MRRNRFFEIGGIVLAIGAVTSVIGGIGEVNYFQCVAASGPSCSAASSMFTGYQSNADMLGVGMNIAFIGVVIMVGGIITNYVVKLADEMKAGMAPVRVCPKCGTQLALTSKFCPSCGNQLGG